MKKLSFILCLFVITTQCLAQKTVYVNEFLNIGVGAKNLGMGTASSALSNDVFSTYWNPSGLMNIKDNFQIGVMHNEVFAGLSAYDYVGLAIPIRGEKMNMAVGLSFVRLGTDNIPNTLSLVEPDGSVNYDNVSFFTSADNAYFLTWAGSINKIKNKFNYNDLKFGATAKIINRKVGTFGKSFGYGLDLGASYTNNNIHAGLSLRDISTTYNAWTFSFTDEEKTQLAITGNEIPINSYEITNPTISIGGGYDLLLLNNDLRITPAVDFNFYTGGKRNTLIGALNLEPALGLEVGYNDFVFLRVGLGRFQKYTGTSDGQRKKLVGDPNAGIGLQFKGLAVDYCFGNFNSGQNKLFSHIISLKYGLKRQDRENEEKYIEDKELNKIKPEKVKEPKPEKKTEPKPEKAKEPKSENTKKNKSTNDSQPIEILDAKPIDSNKENNKKEESKKDKTNKKNKESDNNKNEKTEPKSTTNTNEKSSSTENTNNASNTIEEKSKTTGQSQVGNAPATKTNTVAIPKPKPTEKKKKSKKKKESSN